MGNFLLSEFILLFINYCSSFFLGKGVEKYNWNVNYTRKVLSLSVFITALLINDYLNYNLQSAPWLSVIFVTILLYSFSEKWRKKSSFLATCFSAMDRPEDRPYTLYWLSTEVIVNFLIIMSFSTLYRYVGVYNFSYLTVLIVSLGDGLAEPIGVRFGYHKYKTYAFFVKDRVYTRSLQGSAAVYCVSFAIICIFSHIFTPAEFIYALCIIPIVATIAEAKSPHTWDGPLMHIACHSAIIAIIYFIR